MKEPDEHARKFAEAVHDFSSAKASDNVTRPCPKCCRPVPIDATRCIDCWAQFSAVPNNSTGQNRTLPPADYLAGRGSQRSSLVTQLGIGGLNNRTVIAVGIVIAIIGVALIIISPNLLFVEHVPERETWAGIPIAGTGGGERITDLRNVTMFFGVALLIVGGIVSAVGFSQFKSTQPTTPPAPTTQAVVTQSVSPKSVALGNTLDEAQSVMGQPDKIIDLGARVFHVYKDMKIIYVDGKVSDVQLS